MLVRLVRKLADQLDGINVSAYHEGEVLDLPERTAALLVAERWAVPARRREVRGVSTVQGRSMAADRAVRGALERLRRPSADLEPGQGRRAEDRIREELHDARATTIPARPRRR